MFATDKSIRLFVTGGTFDKSYDEINGRLYFKDTHVAEMLKLARSQMAVDVRTLMMIDSLDMTAADRDLILKNCQASLEPRIVITHGTDTMSETAAVLGPVIRDKTVVFTGALIPYEFGSSDGLFNLGSALAFAQMMPPGVYVAMNGVCHIWNNVKKDRSTGLFKPLV